MDRFYIPVNKDTDSMAGETRYSDLNESLDLVSSRELAGGKCRKVLITDNTQGSSNTNQEIRDYLNTVGDLKSRNPRESRTIFALRVDSQENFVLLLQPRKISNQARPFKYKLRLEKITSEGSLASKIDVVTRAYFQPTVCDSSQSDCPK